jgi:hypothetical protein
MNGCRPDQGHTSLLDRPDSDLWRREMRLAPECKAGNLEIALCKTRGIER